METVGGLVADLQVDDKGLDQAIVRASTGMSALAAEARRLDAELKRGAITTADHAARTRDLAAAQAQLGTALQAAYAKSATSASQMALGMDGMKTGGVNAARGILQASYALEDLQYGVGAVINNIPQLLMAFGVGAGLTGVIAMATVGLKVLTDHWHEFTTAIGFGAVESATEEMERLGKATHKTADEQERLNTLKSREATHKEIVSDRSPSEKESESRIKAAIAEAGGREVMKSLLEIEKPFHKMTPQDEEEIANTRRRDELLKEHTSPTNRAIQWWKGDEAAVRKRIEERLQQENAAQVDKMLDQALGREGSPEQQANARKGLSGIIGRNPGAFPAGLGGRIADADPGRIAEDKAIRKAEADSAAIDAQTDKLKAAKQAELVAANDYNAAVDEATNRILKERNQEAIDARKYNEDIDEATDKILEARRQELADSYEARKEGRREVDRQAIAKDEAAARRLKAEQADAFDREQGRGPRNVKEERETSAALRKLAGIDVVSDRAYTQALAASGGDGEKARDMLQAQLEKVMQANGMDPEIAKEEARKRADATAAGINEEIMRGALSPDLRQSRVFDMAGLNTSVQSSISNKDTTQQRMLDALIEIKRWTLNFKGFGQPIAAGGK